MYMRIYSSDFLHDREYFDPQRAVGNPFSMGGHFRGKVFTLDLVLSGHCFTMP